jgi:hypothetical protein
MDRYSKEQNGYKNKLSPTAILLYGWINYPNLGDVK